MAAGVVLAGDRPYLTVVLLEGAGEGAAEAEVGDLERPGPAVHKQVVGLEVAVQHPAAVNKGDALTQLIHQDMRMQQIKSMEPQCKQTQNSRSEHKGEKIKSNGSV
jgi:hypothetical protein